MRVMHVITRMIVGGAQENTLFNCLDLQRDFGDDVVLVTGPTDGPEGRLLEQGRGGALEIEIVPELIRSIRPLTDRAAYRQLRLRIREWRPDVVHTHSAKGGFLGRLAAWHERVPAVIHTVHGAPFHPYQSFVARRLFRDCERFAAKRCHAMISVADAMTDLMVGAGVAPREKFTTIYSGMDIEPFLAARQARDAARREFGLADDDLVVGKVARLFRLKGHEDLVRAAAETVRRHPRVRFLLVGDGTLRPAIEDQVRRAGLERHFVFAGLVPPERVPYCMAAMDLLVHTSLREGLARTLPQALLTGIPVISYDIDGAREVCLDGRTGVLVPPRDIPALIAALDRLCGDAAARERMGGAGAVLCRERFPHRLMTRRIRELYERVLGDSDRAVARVAGKKGLN